MAKQKIHPDVSELQNKYLRALADYQNLEKRLVHERERLLQESKKIIISPFLDIKDDLDSASAVLNDEGLQHIARKMKDALTRLGVEELDPMDKPYDPHTMECIETQEGKENLVTKVHKKGYRLGTLLLRPASVTVSIINSPTKKEEANG